MKLLFVITDTDRRGAQVFGTDLASALRGRGHEVMLRALAPGTRPNGIEVDALGPSRRSARTLAGLRAAARDNELVLACGSTTLPMSVLATVGLSTPVVYRSVGTIGDWAVGRVRRPLTTFMLGRCAAVVALWPGAAVALAEGFGVDPERISVIPGGVPVDGFPLAGTGLRQRARADLGVPDDAPLIAIVGSLTSEKRVGLAIDAVSRLDRHHLVVAGDGPERAALEERARGIESNRIRFLGVVEDPRMVYAACDALVLPSASEGVPGVLIEAALSGRPAVATDVGGVATVVVDGVTGRVVDVDATAATIAEALTFVLERAEDMGAAALRHAAARFDMDVIADRYEELLTSGVTRP